MIQEVITYDIICDNCGKSFQKEAEVMFTDIESAQQVAEESEWHTMEGRKYLYKMDQHYCPDCFTIGDDDELVILNNQP